MRKFDERLHNNLASRADTMVESIRYLNHHTLGLPIPGPVAQGVLWNLAQLGHMLPQTFDQLAAGLDQSVTSFAVREGDGTDPARNINIAVVHLYEARANARRIGQLLERAQAAVSCQFYR